MLGGMMLRAPAMALLLGVSPVWAGNTPELVQRLGLELAPVARTLIEAHRMCRPQRRVGFERKGDLNGTEWFNAAMDAGDVDGVSTQVPNCCGGIDGFFGYPIVVGSQALNGMTASEFRAAPGVEQVTLLGNFMARKILAHVEERAQAEVSASTEATLTNALGMLDSNWPKMVKACTAAIGGGGL